MNYDLECVLGDVSRYIVFNEAKIAVGTVEIIPYDTEKASYLDTFFPFGENDVVKKYPRRIAEFEGVSIKREHRRDNNLDRVLYTFTEHSRLNNIKLGIGLLNPLLYLALKNTYKIPILKIGKQSIKHKSSVYPVIIDAEYVYKNIEEFPWLYKIYELDNNLARKLIYREEQPFETNICGKVR